MAEVTPVPTPSPPCIEERVAALEFQFQAIRAQLIAELEARNGKVEAMIHRLRPLARAFVVALIDYMAEGKSWEAFEAAEAAMPQCQTDEGLRCRIAWLRSSHDQPGESGQ